MDAGRTVTGIDGLCRRSITSKRSLAVYLRLPKLASV
jgi:hypothetical protein